MSPRSAFLYRGLLVCDTVILHIPPIALRFNSLRCIPTACNLVGEAVSTSGCKFTWDVVGRCTCRYRLKIKYGSKRFWLLGLYCKSIGGHFLSGQHLISNSTQSPFCQEVGPPLPKGKKGRGVACTASDRVSSEHATVTLPKRITPDP